MSARRARPPAVAGSFYPANPTVLRREVEGLLTAAAPPDGEPPKALIAPHAGYAYSGPVAATAFKTLRPVAERLRRVVLLGPAHRVAFEGLALDGAEAFETPLGPVPVDGELAERALGLRQVRTNPRAHAEEHSLEVELPFLQVLLPAFALLPLVVGDATGEEVAEVLEAVWGGPETLLVISSDLSHYLPYEEARAIDAETAGRILALRPPLHPRQACGAYPVNGLLTAARSRGLGARLLDLRSSGDTAGGRDQVVGYGAFAFHSPPSHADAHA